MENLNRHHLTKLDLIIYFLTFIFLISSVGLLFYALVYLKNNEQPRQIIYPKMQVIKNEDNTYKNNINSLQINSKADITNIMNSLSGNDIASASSVLDKIKKDFSNLSK